MSIIKNQHTISNSLQKLHVKNKLKCFLLLLYHTFTGTSFAIAIQLITRATSATHICFAVIFAKLLARIVTPTTIVNAISTLKTNCKPNVMNNKEISSTRFTHLFGQWRMCKRKENYHCRYRCHYHYHYRYHYHYHDRLRDRCSVHRLPLKLVGNIVQTIADTKY